MDLDISWILCEKDKLINNKIDNIKTFLKTIDNKVK
jgi:hypothetical protein